MSVFSSPGLSSVTVGDLEGRSGVLSYLYEVFGVAKQEFNSTGRQPVCMCGAKNVSLE